MINIPSSTYRVQLRPGFGFAQCRDILPYLKRLGISHIYASPIFKAVKGSEHGYDVCDHQALNPELGSAEEFDALMAETKRLGMGWIQDIVPNHMAVSGDNRMLVDLLENGPDSRYFPFFDIEWDHPLRGLTGRMLAPFLGKHYSQALENGEIRLVFDADGFHARYFDITFPLRIDSYTTILTRDLEALRNKLGRDHSDYIKLLGILYSIKSLAGEKATDERYDQIYFIKHMLIELYESSEVLHNFINTNVKAFNGEIEPTGGDRYDLMDSLLGGQYFRLSFWKVAGEEINYRRFFSINNLVSLRVENETVFNHAHRLILDRIRDGSFTGLRVDHIDGLYNPSFYLKRLREHAPDAYIAVEKVLSSEEPLPGFWPVQGTTGYDFMNMVCGLFIRPEAEKGFQSLYAAFTEMKKSLSEILAEKKRNIIEHHMAGDVDNLARLVNTVSSKDRRGFDITLAALRQAITELLIRFPVYRTYISPEAFRPQDLTYVRSAVRATRRANPILAFELEFLERFLLLEFDERTEEADRREWTHFVMRFQQATGPLMAKGLEDSAFYVMNRLLCLNEVGGDPDRFGVEEKAWNLWIKKRSEAWPAAMNATATHDAKRGEDARMRLAALSQSPSAWREALKAFRLATRKKKKRINGRGVPSNNDEYFIFQTILACLPFSQDEAATFPDRLQAYVVKAVREAKEYSNWINPEVELENAYGTFAKELIEPGPRNAFLKEFTPLWRRIARIGIINSLSQTLIKVASPGVPDFYQGTELWDFSMVDPDNRRPVDFALRAKLLEEIERALAKDRGKLLSDLLDNAEDGRIKLFLIRSGLAARLECADLFGKGDYVVPEIKGAKANQVLAFARTWEGNAALTVVPRLAGQSLNEDTAFPLGTFWGDTTIAWGEAAKWRNAFTGTTLTSSGDLALSDVFAGLPFALLISDNAGTP
jgi:(1->4)-alpha-D-glucan 1-alpha-D-glucosylmutase